MRTAQGTDTMRNTAEIEWRNDATARTANRQELLSELQRVSHLARTSATAALRAMYERKVKDVAMQLHCCNAQ
jgi:hypothetical protein